MKSAKIDEKILEHIIYARRDVRGDNFLDKEISPEDLEKILLCGMHAPSVGYCQPWRFVVIDEEDIKQEIYENFTFENEKAKKIFKDKKIYKDLKLEGIKEAPINIAVFYEEQREPILGMTSMRSMGEYSVVCAVQNMWLMARALNIGLGWISILDDKKVMRTLNAPKGTKLIAYLALGYVDKFYKEPELKTIKWSKKKMLQDCVILNQWV